MKDPTTVSIETLPDHDFHSAWGCSYSNRSALSDDFSLHLWHQYASDPASIERKYHVLLNQYTEMFSTFFAGYWPISLHAHASDVLVPTTIAGMIRNTVSSCPLVLDSPSISPFMDPNPDGTKVRDFNLDFLGWNDNHVYSPNFVYVEGTYGTAFGPLAHTSKEWEVNIIATGPKPFRVTLSDTSLETLDLLLAEAKAQGCIGILFVMVSTEDGSVMPPEKYGILKACAYKNKLLIIVDETMTAIRCGAPFTIQRPEYAQAGNPLIQPDVVVFGKGLTVSGLAINFQGAMLRHLAFVKIEDIKQTIRFWRALMSRPIGIPTLIEAFGILRRAQAEDWPARSMRIGEAIREVVRDCDIENGTAPTEIRGLGAMLAVHQDVAMRYRIMSAIRRRSPWVRWLPKLDRCWSDPAQLRRHVFGPESIKSRQKLVEEAENNGTIPLWCFICGIEAISEEWCRTCYLALCDNEVCAEVFHRHICV